MEDIQLFDSISIKSSIRDYNVFFERNYFSRLTKDYLEGDLIILDSNISKLHPDIINRYPNSITIESNELSKSYLVIANIIDQIISKNFRRDNKLIAIGGGIIQDITAFIASVLYRGVEWIFYPTNVLSQCDSCIGSKTSINFNNYKNLLGGFYPPKHIVIDTTFLKTLNKLDIASGLGEILHYCLVSSKLDFDLFLTLSNKILQNIETINLLLQRSLLIKKEMIEIDEFDKGPRNIFNYGHSFGHALESTLDYKIPHGIAVSIGIDIANVVSNKYNYLSIAKRNEYRKGCEIVYSNFNLPDIDINKFVNALLRDKKNKENKLGLILTKEAGNMFLNYSNLEEVKPILINYFSNKLYLTDL
jgi:3-dehydroquinate synthase